MIPAQWLGQSGVRLDFGGQILVTDPYLSHCVEEAEGPAAKRLRPIDVAPEKLTGVHGILISHLHLDHCDPKTLLPMLKASPNARVLAPAPVFAHLETLGVPRSRLELAREDWIAFLPGLEVRAVPACHPTIERPQDQLACVGYLIRYQGRTLYFAGDTSPHEEILSTLRHHGPIGTALLPVNERNYFKERAGILGNMSLREAFQLAQEAKIARVVPIHWDMFALNSVHRAEIELVYRLEKEAGRADFALQIEPREIIP